MCTAPFVCRKRAVVSNKENGLLLLSYSDSRWFSVVSETMGSVMRCFAGRRHSSIKHKMSKELV